MKLIISYNHNHDWYVGEIHRFIHNAFVDKYPNVIFEFIPIRDLQHKYNIGDYSGSFPSFFNQYNLIIWNPENNYTFINSLNDHAPFCLYPGGGVENFVVKKFGFCSNFHESMLGPIKQYNPTPSFYILENFSDIDRVKRYRSKSRIINKAYFLGLIYGSREIYLKLFQNSTIVDFVSKRENCKSKEDYFNNITDYSMSFSVDGAAKICHRDIESIGVGNLLVREHLNITMHDSLIANKHYLEILTETEKSLVYEPNSHEMVKNLIETRIKNIIDSKDLFNTIINEGIEWYEKNCLPIKQFELIDSFTDNLNIFI